MSAAWRDIAAALLAAGAFPALAVPAADTLTPQAIARLSALSPLAPPPLDETNRVADDERAARLGHRLFFERRFAPDGAFACATCHDPAQAFADGRAVARGRRDRHRNTPSLLNAAQQRWLNWDGSADSLWAQALEPIEHPDEIDGDRVSAVRLVASDPTLRREYEALFGPLPDVADASRFPPRARPAASAAGANARSPIGGTAPSTELDTAWRSMRSEDRAAIDLAFANLGKAIAAYERRLVSADAPFDRFVAGVRGNDAAAIAALSPAAQRGAALFVGKANCRLCHSGPLLSDGEFHALGAPIAGAAAPTDSGRYDGLGILAADPFNAAGTLSDDRGGPRAERTRSVARGPEQWGRFRTPSLRNVARTAPYMHAGQLATLADVVRFYSTLEGQVVAGHHRETVLVPLALTDAERADLVAFLESLTGGEPAPEWRLPPAAR